MLSGKSLVRTVMWILIAALGIGAVIVLALVALFARGCLAIPAVTSCAIVKLPADNLSADFYDGSQFLAAGVNSVNVTIMAGQVRHINVRKITDNSFHASDMYGYDDTMLDVAVPAGQSQTFVIGPPKDYHKGQVNLTCDIQNEEPSDDVFCQPVIDNQTLPTLSGGKTSTYALDTGTHSLHIALGGADASIWFPAADDKELGVTAGDTSTLTETFTRMTLLTVMINKSGVVGDLFLDGKMIGDQVASAHEYVKPNASYTLIGSNFTDPAAQGGYRWNTVGIGVDIGAETQKTVTLPMQKNDLTGRLQITCHLEGFKSTDQVQCSILVDGGEPVTQADPETQAEVSLTPGVHTLTFKLTGADAAKWLTPPPQRVSIHTGQVTNASSLALLRSSITPTVAPSPTSPPPAPIATLTPPPGQPGVPTNTPKPPSIYTGTLSNFGANARAIYLRGKSLGRDPHKFSKVGDCETDSPYFLIPFDQGAYNLVTYKFLDPVVKYFSGSFQYHSVAGHGSFVVASVLDSEWSDPSLCQPGETPLACEYRTHNPSVALIMLRTYPYPWEQQQRDKYIADMRTVIEYTINQGIVPVVSTIPLIQSSPDELHDMNNIIRQLAAEYNIPLWDFYATLSTLPDNGINDSSHLTVPNDGGTTFNGDDMNYGMTRRNLESLEVLHDLLHNVMY